MLQATADDGAAAPTAPAATSWVTSEPRRATAEGLPVLDRIRRFISECFFVDDVGDDQSFLETGIIDSLGIVQIVAFVESELGVRVPDTDLVPANFDSIARIAAYVDRRRQER